MSRSEIKQFILNTGGASYECTTPFTLSSCREVRSVPKSATYRTTLVLDARAIDFKYIYLRLTDVVGLKCIRIGDGFTVSGAFTGRVLNLNVKEYLRVGENKIELCFEQPEGIGRVAGLYGSLQVLNFNGAVIDHVGIKESFEGGSATVEITVDMLGSTENVRAVATLVSGAGHVFYSGLTRGKGTIAVKDPLFWWPKGMGVQNLYKLTVNLYGEMEIEDTVEMRVGIRKITASDSAVLGVGDAELLPMGAVYRVESGEDPVLSKNRSSAFINSAARVGMSAIMIPDSDPLPTEDVLDLCDAHGIVIIREIHSSSIENNNEELDTLARIAHHPSVAVYNVIYDTGNASVLRERLARIAPNTAVIICDKQFERPSFASLPSDRVTNVFLASDERNLFSERMEREGREQILDMIIRASERFPYAGGFSDFAYVSSVCAAEQIMEKMEVARLNRGESFPIYDGLGDTKLGLSYSGIDAHAIWGAPHYYAARFFAPLRLVPNHLGDGRVEFYVSNERRSSFVGKLSYRIADNKNKTVCEGSEQCVIERATAKLVLERDFGEFVRGHEQEYYIEYSLSDPMGKFSAGTMLFVPEKHFAFLDPKIKAEVVGSDRRFSILLSAEAYAKAVEIKFSDTDAVFFDNYVDITDSVPVKISFTLMGESKTASELNNTLHIMSIYDVKRS